MSVEPEADPVTLSGVVTELKCEKPTFCAGRLTSNGRSVSFSVKGFVRANEPVTLRGRWETHPRWGRQFKGTEVVYTMPADADGIAAWLAATVDGCGPAKARQMTEVFGQDLPQRLADSPEQVAVECRLPIEFVTRAAERWFKQAERANLCAALADFGLTQHEIDKLVARYKGSAVEIVRTDPYLLLGDLPGFGWTRVDAIGKKMGFAPTFPGRVRAAAVEVVRGEYGSGTTVATREAVLGSAADMLGATVPRADIAAAVEQAVGLGVLVPLGEDGLALRPAALVETALWRHLAGATAPNPLFADLTPDQVEDAVAACRSVSYRGERADLDDTQFAAVRAAAASKLSVVTGGAGAGKTLLAKAIADLFATGRTAGAAALQAYREHRDPFGDADPDADDFDPFAAIGSGTANDPRIAFCAPTGKAARRLTDVLGREAGTIHRLLMWRPDNGTFFHGRENPLPYDAVIVDEVSMVDAALLCSLLDAVGPHTAVVLIGDPNQLPPVGAGYPLRDLIEHRLAPVTRLEKCHRQAGHLKRNSVRVLAGVVEPSVIDAGDPGPWLVHRALSTPDQITATVRKLFEDLFPRWAFGGVMDHQFVTARHDGKLGTRNLNELLQRLAQARLGVTLAERGPDDALPLLLGDKVIHTKNNYTLGVMNGTVGVVVEESPLCVEYDGRRVAYPAEVKSQVQLAYCLTVHKVQGSEYPCIVVVCPSAHAFMQHRSWLYTGVTRARSTAVVIGDADGIRRAAEKVETSRRRTILEFFAKHPDAAPGGDAA